MRSICSWLYRCVFHIGNTGEYHFNRRVLIRHCTKHYIGNQQLLVVVTEQLRLWCAIYCKFNLKREIGSRYRLPIIIFSDKSDCKTIIG